MAHMLRQATRLRLCPGSPVAYPIAIGITAGSPSRVSNRDRYHRRLAQSRIQSRSASPPARPVAYPIAICITAGSPSCSFNISPNEDVRTVGLYCFNSPDERGRACIIPLGLQQKGISWPSIALIDVTDDYFAVAKS